MRTPLLACVIAVLVAPPVMPAQITDSLPLDSVADDYQLPRAVALEIASLFNQPAALRATGTLVIDADQQVTGDVAVLGGSLTLAGRVTGRVLVINGDVTLRRGATIGSDLMVVGGMIEGQDRASVGGQIRWYRQPLYYRRAGDRIVVEPEDEIGEVAEEGGWLARWRRRNQDGGSKIVLIAGGTYNRVEGLPISLGPAFRQRTPWGRVSLEALGIIRSADNFRWDRRNIGYEVEGEVQFGRSRRIAVGSTLFDVVDAVEQWHLGENEVSLAAFFLRRDYQDYFNRHGARGYIRFRGWNNADLTLAYRSERWGTREERGVFSLFRDADHWRPNPRVDVGRFHIASAALTIDTRNDPDNPWTGWYITTDLERGSSRSTVLGETSPLARSASEGPVGVAYTRGFLDLRRYNRLSPKGQLNKRLVLGGWLGGDPLPLQRRLSVSGPATLPGYDFRTAPGDPDVWQCSDRVQPPGQPAQCERVALAQVEYRGDLRVTVGGRGRDDDDDRGWHFSFDRTGAWVVFVDAGRGWLVGPSRVGDLQYRSGAFPALRTFRTDVGVGLDLDIIGLYIAKAVSVSEGANLFIRLRHRF
ncbi:MAG: polymer-forming cytoskeletal protein [Chloroflexota bacterium]|nr:polymer-forming cytoskeletal protein [Chloroflexota bacterium]